LNPVGTGPFKMVEFKPAASIKFVKNDNYWEPGKPYLDAINCDYVADKTVASMAFEKGDADILMQITEQIANDLKNKGFVIRAMAGSSWFLISDSKNADSPFSNPKVREAVDYAIDKVSLTKAVGYGLLYPSYQLAPPEIVGYNPDLKPRLYDPAKAKQLLKEAGYPTGFKTKLIAQNTYNQDPIIAMQKFLKDVGIDATLDFPDAARWTEIRSKGWVNGLALSRTGTDPNMNQQLVRDLATNTQWFPSSARPAMWQSVIDDSVAARDVETRKAKLQQLMKMNYDEIFTHPLWIGCDLAAMQKYVNTDFLVTHHVQWKPGDTWLNK
jgi:ABC-type transport system substrate-binding protein